MATEVYDIKYRVDRGDASRAQKIAERLATGAERAQKGAERAGKATGSALTKGAQRAQAGFSRLDTSARKFADSVAHAAKRAVSGLRRVESQQDRVSKAASKSGGMIRKGLSSIGAGIGLGLGAQIASAATSALGSAFGEPEAIRAAADRAAKSAVFSVGAFGRLEHAAKLSGTSIETLENASLKLNSTLAKKVPPEMERALKTIGVSAEELKKLDPEQQIHRIAEGFQSLDNDQDKVLVTTALLGKGMKEMVPLLGSGASGIKGMGKEAEDLGLVFTDDAAKAAERIGDAQTRLGAVFEGAGREVFSALAPGIADASEAALDFLQANKDIIGVGLEKVMGVLGRLFSTAGETISYVSEALGPQVEELWPALEGGINATLDVVENLREPVTAALGAFMDMLGPAIEIIKELLPYLEVGLTVALEGVSSAMEGLKSLLGGVLDAFRAFKDGNIIDGLKKLGSALVDTLIAPLRFIAGQLVDLADGLGSSNLVPAALRRFAGRTAIGGALGIVNAAAEKGRKQAESDFSAEEAATPAPTPPTTPPGGGSTLLDGTDKKGKGKKRTSAFGSAIDSEIKKRADAAGFAAAQQVAARGGSIAEQEAAALKASRDEMRRLKKDPSVAADVMKAQSAKDAKSLAKDAKGSSTAVKLDVGAGAGSMPPVMINNTNVRVESGAVNIAGDFASSPEVLGKELENAVSNVLADKIAGVTARARTSFLA